MFKWRTSYNPYDSKDISKFMTGIGELYLKGTKGMKQAAELCLEISKDKTGRELLLNAHRFASYQLPKIVEPNVFHMMKWMQNLFAQHIPLP